MNGLFDQKRWNEHAGHKWLMSRRAFPYSSFIFQMLVYFIFTLEHAER